MNSVNNINNNFSFKGRCPQIKDAQWVCHVVNTAYPHVSTTRFSAPMYKLKKENPGLYSRFLDKNPFNFVDPFNFKELKLIAMFDWQKRLIDKLNRVRKEWQYGCKTDSRRVNNLIGQLKYNKIGNCGEDAMLAEAILKLNGVDNACTAGLNVNNLNIFMSICTNDDKMAKIIEPLASRPTKRINALSILKENNIKCGALISPYLPYITDYNIF